MEKRPGLLPRPLLFIKFTLQKIKLKLYKSTYRSPIGDMTMLANDAGLMLLEFDDSADLDHEIAALIQHSKEQPENMDNTILQQCKKELDEYFAGKRKSFETPVVLTGTAFQQMVWQQLKTIDYGHTSHYEEQAIKAGNVAAIRALANANGKNKICIIIPCHRVIGKDGSMTGYAGGINRKRWLLTHERANSKARNELF